MIFHNQKPQMTVLCRHLHNMGKRHERRRQRSKKTHSEHI